MAHGSTLYNSICLNTMICDLCIWISMFIVFPVITTQATGKKKNVQSSNNWKLKVVYWSIWTTCLEYIVSDK